MSSSTQSHVCPESRGKPKGGSGLGGVGQCVDMIEHEGVHYENVIVIVKDHCQA